MTTTGEFLSGKIDYDGHGGGMDLTSIGRRVSIVVRLGNSVDKVGDGRVRFDCEAFIGLPMS